MIDHLSLSTAGFSLFALILLFIQKRTESRLAHLLANFLLLILFGIQLMHLFYLNAYAIFSGIMIFVYLLLLGLVGPVFYLYSQHIINSEKKWNPVDNLHLLFPLFIATAGFIYPEYFNLAYSMLFLLGGFYMAKLALSLYQLRTRRTLFRMEFTLTALFLCWAIVVVVASLYAAKSLTLLIPLQTILLALAIAAAVHIQLNYPHLLSSLEEIARRQYQSSTLLSIDTEKARQQLTELMQSKQVFQDPELSLPVLADMLSLKSHQLSELINTQLGMSFSSYLRSQRIKAAEKILVDEPEVSVLAVGLSVGFSSQSAFYSAFKEIHQMAPGQFRQKTLVK